MGGWHKKWHIHVLRGKYIAANGAAEGSVGAKTADKSFAQVGDTLTYTITLAMPPPRRHRGRELKFPTLSPSTCLSFPAALRRMGVHPPIFHIVLEAEQGLYIVNTAVVSSDDREDIQLPDTGVQIDGGDTAPYMSKAA